MSRDYKDEWQEMVMARFDRLEQMIHRLLNPITIIEGENLLDNQDVCEILKISKRTLQRYRSDEGLPYEMVRHKTLYKESDVKNFVIEQFNKRAQKQENDEDEL